MIGTDRDIPKTHFYTYQPYRDLPGSDRVVLVGSLRFFGLVVD